MNNEIRTDLDIFLNGVQVEALVNVGPEEAGPYIQAVSLGCSLGQNMELRFSNPDVFALATLILGMTEGLTITLKSEAEAA